MTCNIADQHGLPTVRLKYSLPSYCELKNLRLIPSTYWCLSFYKYIDCELFNKTANIIYDNEITMEYIVVLSCLQVSVIGGKQIRLMAIVWFLGSGSQSQMVHTDHTVQLCIILLGKLRNVWFIWIPARLRLRFGGAWVRNLSNLTESYEICQNVILSFLDLSQLESRVSTRGFHCSSASECVLLSELVKFMLI